MQKNIHKQCITTVIFLHILLMHANPARMLYPALIWEFYNMKKCVFSIGSVTHAIKAQRALSDFSVPSKIVKTQSDDRGRGCIYGIEFDNVYCSFASDTMIKYGISFKKITQ